MDCAGCGACCDPVWLGLTPLELASAMARMQAGARVSSADGEANLRFIAGHMLPLDPQPEAYLDGGPASSSGHVAWSCDRYDPASRLCTAHDERPPICRGWPWYGDAPFPHDAMPASCSHNWDVTPAARGELVGRLLPLWPAT